MNYPKLREDSELFNFDGHIIDDPYQWIRNGKQVELLQWVRDENDLTDSFFIDNYEIYQKHLAKNKSKKAEPEIYALSKCIDGYMVTESLEGVHTHKMVDEDFNTVKDFTDMLAKVENVVFYMGKGSPINKDIVVFEGQVNGADRPSLYVFSLYEEKLLATIPGVFYFDFKKGENRLLYGDAVADPANKITHCRMKEFDVTTLEEKLIYAYDKNAIDIGTKAGIEANEYVGEIMSDYSNNLIIVVKDGQPIYFDENPDVYKYIGHDKSSYFICDYTKKPEGQIVRWNLNENEREVIFEMDNFFIKGCAIENNRIYIQGTKDVSSALYVLTNSELFEIALPTHCHASIKNGDEANKECILIDVESFTIKPSIYAIDGDELVLFKGDEETDNDDIVVEQRFYPSVEDGVLIPCYLVHKKDMAIDGTNKTLMYGYGGYNIDMPPWYHEAFIGLDIVDWVRDGGLYVHTNLRGGNEYGEAWHQAGMKLTKKNCYYDFIGIAEGIIKDGFTSPKYITINGGSNGGLLVTTLLTMRPDLWGCVVGSVPHTDMISFVNDDRGPMYITEYGDPHDPEQFEYFMSYSPFQNIKHTNYPYVYLQTGECDNNVPPYHGKKFAARLQQWNTSDNPVVFRVLSYGSHDRGAGNMYVRTISEMQAFVEIAMKANAAKD